MLSDENFYIDSRVEEGIDIVSVKGSILTEKNSDFSMELMKFVEKKHVVLDLESTTFISSSGLGSIMGFVKKIRENSGDMVIAGPNKFILNTLKITQISSVIQIFSSVDDAVDDLILKDF